MFLTLSTNYYDALLLSWANQIPQQHVMFDAGNSQSTKDSLAQTARNALVDTFGWTIMDAGSVESVR
ncbi:hypothetical protein [Marinicellulosiphila megalodicopiae]|uniref:hypothetical protein n=1 Tax=Marinicellulosiphila megalodicopiae TaxID=2724896 RepID=UPI003BAFF13B